MILLWQAIILLVGCGLAERLEPYAVLGVHRRASNQEIRKAYKAKIKEWHPDLQQGHCSLAPNCDLIDQFVQVNQAYELLSDPERRRSYDNHGITEDSPNFNNVSPLRELSILNP